MNTSVLTKNILHQKVKVAITPGVSRLSGEQTISFSATHEGAIIAFDAGPLTVTAASLDGTPVVEWRKSSSGLEFVLPEVVAAGSEHRLAVSYEASPKRGF